MRAGLTPTQVADATDLPPEVYVRMERGKLVPTLTTLHALCQTLRIGSGWLRYLSVPRA
jgi:DNA-binding XRE family transcriptional regulator